MKKGIRLHDIAVFVEFLVGSGLAIFFHAVLHYEQSAYVIFAMGILLSLVTYLVREDIEKAKKRLLDRYDESHEIPFAMARISDPECRQKAQELVASSLKTIAMLQTGYIPLDEMEFCLEGARLCDQAARRITAVDPLTTGWLTRGALVNYYQANLRALDRGVHITRIFVATREELSDPEVQKVIIGQYRSDIDVRVAFRDELPSMMDITGRDTASSFDFAIYDDRVATEVFAQPGKYFGRKTSHLEAVTKYRHLYDLIEHCAHVVALEEERIVLATEVLAQAS